MNDPLDRLETTAERIIGRSEYEQTNRRGLLWIHGLMGMLAGTQMAIWGSARTIEEAAGANSRYFMAGLGITGGVILARGLVKRPRSIALEVIGLALVWLWDVLMTIGLAYARIEQNNYWPIHLGDDLPVGYVVAYPITVYAGLAALITIHLWTLRRLLTIRPAHPEGGA